MSNDPVSRAAVLVVDDEEAVLASVKLTLRAHGISNVLTCSDSREIMGLIDEHPVGVVLLDLVMPHVGGEEVLAQINEHHPELGVIVVTAENDVRTAVSCMKRGALDYLPKPVEPELLVATVERAFEQLSVRNERDRLREQFFTPTLQHPQFFEEIITSAPSMRRIFSYIEAVANGSQPVLISGATGSGKELLARALHRSSGRDGPFVALNVAGLDDEMFSDTLLGHTPGAFTGAQGARSGMIERAGEGSLFLDEIGDLSEASQVKLLRILQEREYHPLGSDTAKPLRARVIAATHRDPSALRRDLFYRLRAYHVKVPPLTARLEDLPLLLQHFSALAANDLGRPLPTLPSNLVDRLRAYHFPGNVRELQSMVFHAVAEQESQELSVASFINLMEAEEEPAMGDAPQPPSGAAIAPAGLLTPEDFQRIERENIERALESARWKISGAGGAAERLGLKPSTLTSKMKKLGINKS